MEKQLAQELFIHSTADKYNWTANWIGKKNTTTQKQKPIKKCARTICGYMDPNLEIISNKLFPIVLCASLCKHGGMCGRQNTGK